MEVKTKNKQVLLSSYVISKEDGCYIDPEVFSKTIMKRLEITMSLQDLISYIAGLKMTVTEEEINTYLDERLEKENKELKRRIEKRDNKRNMLEIWQDEEEISKYILKPYILTSSETYIDILKEKCLKLLYFVDTLEKVSSAKKKGNDLLELKEKWQYVSFCLNRYGIELDENIWIHEQSFSRLVEPLIFNVKTLTAFVKRANDKETYYNSDVIREEFPPIPDRKLQREDLTFSHPGYIPLSEAQKEFLQKEQNKVWCQEISEKTQKNKQSYTYINRPTIKSSCQN